MTIDVQITQHTYERIASITANGHLIAVIDVRDDSEDEVKDVFMTHLFKDAIEKTREYYS